ncbi:ATPase, T2SS/T4P/T4SS family [Alcaligenaceae bacterium A4P071]|nr:ATPase, T2SS/T4P/T4SS family [Alcaligenaceae bacterium A4P071]
MIDILLNYEDGRQVTVCAAAPVHIGRDVGCAVRIRHWRVAKRHASIVVIGDALALEDHGSLMGTSVNSQRIATHSPLLATDSVVIGPCLIQVSLASGKGSGGGDLDPNRSDRPADEPVNRMDEGVRQRTDTLTFSHAGALFNGAASLSLDDTANQADDGLTSDTTENGESAEKYATGSGTDDVTDITTKATHASTDTSKDASTNTTINTTTNASTNAAANASTDSTDARDRSAHDALLHALDLRRHDVATMSDATLRHVAGDLLMQILSADRDASTQEQSARCRRILDEVVGLGPLESLLNDDGISEIMINRYDDIYVERSGRLHAAALRFTSEQALRRIIDRIVSRVGRRVDESMPMVDARLTDGSRVNAVLPPIALRGAVLTIRKFMRTRLGMVDLVRTGAMSAEMAAFLRLCVAHRASIVIAGGTGSGKTTLLNILADAIPAGERIVTIEDSAELRLGHAHLVALEARPPNVEGRGLITIRDLVRNALRMRPDRIVVGECRGAEAFDMLAAMNTGHEGSMTTLHANTPRDALARLETMIMMANMGLPLSVVREHIVSSVDLIVQQRRLANGRRVVTEVVELTGMESGCIQSQSLFRFSAATGGFAWGGVLPGIVQRWRDEGHAIDTDMFFSCTPGARELP